jgi:hypothetical protein
MYTVSAAFQAAIALSTVRLTELYDVVLANGTTYRYTSHDKDITWNAGSDTYTSVPGLRRGPIKYGTDGSFSDCKINLAIISGDLRANLMTNILEAAVITIKLIRWDATFAADEEITLFVGTPDVSFNTNALSLRLVSTLESLNILVPAHIYQPACNNILFDDTCGLTRATYAYSGTATGGTVDTLIDATAGAVYKASFDGGDSGNPVEIGDALVGNDGTPGDGVCINIIYLTASTGTIWYVEVTHQFVDDEVITGGGNTVTVNGTPAADTTFYEQGEIEMLTGDNAGEFRPVLSDASSVRTVMHPFPAAVANNDTYKIYPGCDGRGPTCWTVYNNRTQFRGFPHVKPVQDMVF